MKTMDKINALQNQVFSEMMVNPSISSNFSEGLKNNIIKIGVAAVFAATALASNYANAFDGYDAVRVAGAGSALIGMTSNGAGKVEGLPVECNVQARNISKEVGAVGGAAAIGSIAGQGNGKLAWTIGSGVIAGTLAHASESNRIEQAIADCQRNIAARNARNGNSSNYAAPGMIPNPQSPVSMILYVFDSSRTHSRYVVTMENSPGVNALRGMRDGAREVSSDPVVSSAIERATQGLQAAYNNLQERSENYIRVTNSTPNDTKSARYAVGYFENNKAERDLTANRKNLDVLNKELNEAHSRFGRERAFAAAIFDNAAIDGYRLAPYGNVLTMFQPPQSATVACQCVLPNKYSGVPAALTSDR